MIPGIYNQVIVEWGLFTALLLIPVVVNKNKVNRKWVGIAAGLFLIHKIIVFLGVGGIYPDLISGRYNWEGKIAGMIFLLVAALVLFPGKSQEWGFRLSQNGDAKKAGMITAIITALIGTGMAWFYFEGVREGATSDWIYQLTMPAVGEELFYRGIMLLILDRAFTQKWKHSKVNWSWGAVVLVAMFYFTHVIIVDEAWNLTIIWGDFLPGFYGLLWMYIRLATGSLLLPVLLHGYINVIGFII